MKEPLAVSVIEAARLGSVSRTTIYTEIANGNLQVHKVGRRTIITVENLRSWLASKAVAHGGEAGVVERRDRLSG